MNYDETQRIVDHATRLDRDTNGNPRYYFPAVCFPFEPGSKEARRDGLHKYRGRQRPPGFVLQSYNLVEDIENILKNVRTSR